MKQMLRLRFGVIHATIEVECEGCEAEGAFCSQLEEPVTAPAAKAD